LCLAEVGAVAEVLEAIEPPKQASEKLRLRFKWFYLASMYYEVKISETIRNEGYYDYIIIHFRLVKQFNVYVRWTKVLQS
jgi:hypothetical protein